MARITVEDCLEHVDNRFELILKAAKRARQLANYGAEPVVPWENDKPAVVALREIAEGHLIAEQPNEPEEPFIVATKAPIVTIDMSADDDDNDNDIVIGPSPESSEDDR